MHFHSWDQTIRSAMALIPHVEQPLITCLDELTRHSLDEHLRGGTRYRLVRTLLRKDLMKISQAIAG